MTARIPGAKRGRPRKPKLPAAPKRDVGRPETPLSAKPYRYALAFYEAYVAMGVSRRRAIVTLEAMYKGPVTVTVDECRGGYRVTVSVELTERIDLDDFAKDCECLRSLTKWHAAKPGDLAWLRPMSEAVRIAMGPWYPEASDMVLRLAASADETAWAREKLLPVLLAEKPAVPELVE